MRLLLFTFLIIGSITSYGQVNFQSNPNDLRYYDYVPQQNTGAMYQALQYKQQIYDQRMAVVQKNHAYCNDILYQIKNEQTRTNYINSYNESGKAIGQMDLTIDADYYSVIDWYRRFEKEVNDIISYQ